MKIEDAMNLEDIMQRASFLDGQIFVDAETVALHVGRTGWLVWSRPGIWRVPTGEEKTWMKMIAFPETLMD